MDYETGWMEVTKNEVREQKERIGEAFEIWSLTCLASLCAHALVNGYDKAFLRVRISAFLLSDIFPARDSKDQAPQVQAVSLVRRYSM